MGGEREQTTPPSSSCSHKVKLAAGIQFLHDSMKDAHSHVTVLDYLTALISHSNYMASYERVRSDWSIGKDMKRGGRGQILRYYHSICLERLRKTTETHDNRSPSRDLYPRPPEYETWVLTTRPRSSVKDSGRRGNRRGAVVHILKMTERTR
jgi:hypothetical protein